jgi:hypothetical protein
MRHSVRHQVWRHLTNPKLLRSEASNAPEHAGEICLILKADGAGNDGHGFISLEQELLGFRESHIVDDGLVAGPVFRNWPRLIG